MPFAALISAYQEAEDEAAPLRALLPMAGRTLLENQVRRAVAAGASHIVVLVERLPAALNAALDRLRRDGIATTVARSPAEAADNFHPGEDVLLVADGLVAAPDCFEAMAARTAPTLLVVADIPENSGFERIDSERRWAGLALTDASTLAQTAAMLGEWDLQSTLMRRIVQAGPTYLPVDGTGGAVADARDAVVLADRSEGSREAGRAMLERNRRPADGWTERYILAPIARLASVPLLERSVEAIWFRAASIVCALGGVTAFWFGWLWSGLALFLLSGPLSAIAAQIDLAQLRDRDNNWERRFASLAIQCLGIAALGWYFANEAENLAYFYAAAGAVVGLFLVVRERANFRLSSDENPWALTMAATGHGAIWLLVPFALAGVWRFWPLFVLGYAIISLIWLQNTVGKAIGLRTKETKQD